MLIEQTLSTEPTASAPRPNVGFCDNERGRSWDARNTASPGVPMHRPRCLGRGAPNRLQQARQQIRRRHRGPAARPTERAELSAAIVCNVYDSEGDCVKRRLFGGIARHGSGAKDGEYLGECDDALRPSLGCMCARACAGGAQRTLFVIYGLESDPVTNGPALMGTTMQPPCSHAHISNLPLVLVTAFCDESVVDAGLLPAEIHAGIEPLGGETCGVCVHKDKAPQAETKFPTSVY
ncbi:hypothetical protein EDB83DRAFT_2551727 [Lactarius deliciosus]|nr:hypothetical protein EDB83DRAFT_2551727 [Lactarius deliciosus]